MCVHGSPRQIKACSALFMAELLLSRRPKNLTELLFSAHLKLVLNRLTGSFTQKVDSISSESNKTKNRIIIDFWKMQQNVFSPENGFQVLAGQIQFSSVVVRQTCNYFGARIN